ncbi:MAG: hypothetical protein ABIQ01_05655 [Pseudolysinimonas sp.]
MSAEKHFAAVRTLLVAGPNLANRVFDTARVDAQGQLIRDTYAVLFGGTPDDRDDDRNTAPQQVDSTAEYVYTTRSVSITADGARKVADQVAAALIGKVATVTGRRCDPLRQTLGGDAEPDRSVTPPLYYIDDEYTLVSRRA